MANRSDNFNRTADPPGTPSDGGSAWVEYGSTSWGTGFDGTSGRTVLYDNSTDTTIALECGDADHTAEVIVVQVPGGGAGLVVRVTDNDNYYLFDCPFAGNSRIYKKVAGSYTLLQNGSIAIAAGDTISFQVSGANPCTLTGKVNGVTSATTTDSDHDTATKAGCRCTNSAGFVFYDDFAITVAGAPAATPKRLLLLGVG
jgi:hypothetical protein